jgi:hypothetical protein
MKIHREVTIECRYEDVPKLGNAISTHLPTGWIRDVQAEAQLNDAKYLCFSSHNRDGIVDSYAWLVYSQERSNVWLANIVPNGSSHLNVSQYNEIAYDLYESALRPGTEGLGFASSISDEDVDYAHYGISLETIELLRNFSSAANKSTGSSHPRDRARWFAFLIAIHKDRAELDSTALGQMLGEDFGWSGEITSDLQIEYEFALGLLKKYDEIQ